MAKKEKVDPLSIEGEPKVQSKPFGTSWDPFTHGLFRGKPGVDSEFDERANPPPWEPT